MHPVSDPLGAPSSFTARRPNASNLPNFELPPPPLSTLQQKYQAFGALNASQTSAAPGALASVGNLLTPPSNLPGDGLSPISGVTSGSSNSAGQNMPPYTPAGYVWPPPSTTGTTPYAFPTGTTPQSMFPPRGLFSPSLSSLARGSNSPTATDGLPPPPYDISLPPFSSSGSMSAPSTLPTLPAHQHGIASSLMNGQPTPISTSAPQQSPINAQDPFRAPPTPSYYSQPPPQNAPQQSPYPYSAGPSPTQQSPLSAGGALTRMSPTNGTIPSMPGGPSQSPHTFQRPFPSYPLPGPVYSNVGNPQQPMTLAGPGLIPGFNSGHAASMGHLYGNHHTQQAAQNDRPFKCDQCPQSFNRNHDLKRHKRIHLAVKPFPCGHCDKSFSRKDALKRHILVKGCGKALGPDDVKMDGSLSPGTKSEVVSPGTESSPIVAAHV